MSEQSTTEREAAGKFGAAAARILLSGYITHPEAIVAIGSALIACAAHLGRIADALETRATGEASEEP